MSHCSWTAQRRSVTIFSILSASASSSSLRSFGRLKIPNSAHLTSGMMRKLPWSSVVTNYCELVRQLLLKCQSDRHDRRGMWDMTLTRRH